MREEHIHAQFGCVMLILFSRYKILFHLYSIWCNLNFLMQMKIHLIELNWITYHLYYEIIVFMYLSLSTNVQKIGIFIMRSTHFIFPYHLILLPPAKHFPHWQLVLCRAFVECDEIIFSRLFLQEKTFENLP